MDKEGTPVYMDRPSYVNNRNKVIFNSNEDIFVDESPNIRKSVDDI
jgi:hypothetical protein